MGHCPSQILKNKVQVCHVSLLSFYGRIQATAEQVSSQDTGEVEDHAQGK
jgi:hypothetical protein